MGTASLIHTEGDERRGESSVIKPELIQLKISKILPKICSYSWVVYEQRDLD